MLKRNKNRKGFTLAELLIVVAIIAVLVAIAVPLFIGALDEAENRVKEANERSVKGVAVSYILENESKFLDATTKKLKGPWTVKATVDTAGTIEIVSILDKSDTTGKTGVEIAEKAKTFTATESGKNSAGGYDIVTEITATDLTALAPATGAGLGG